MEDVGMSEDGVPEESEEDLDSADGLDKDMRSNRAKATMNSKIVTMTTSMSILSYMRSRKCNAMQMEVGYFLYAQGARKRCIDTLNHLGISVSYQTVLRAITAISNKSQAELKVFIRDYPSAWPSVDNMNFYARVRDQGSTINWKY